MDKIIVKGARENNLKNIDIELPKNKLIVMTGVSGSGKSSLAFDTIFAEGQRRYVESLSAYARQFIGISEKPDVDSIEGLSPSISIDQKTTNKNPRSTVGTITEIYDYLRLLYARIGIPYCPKHNIPFTRQSIEEMTNRIVLIVLFVSTKIPYTTIFLMAYFENISRSYEEAAAIDGCHPIRTFWKIVFPMAQGGLVTVTIFNFINIWNEYFLSLMFVNSEKLRPVALGLFSMINGMQYSGDWSGLFASVIIVFLPTFILYVLLSKYIVGGLTGGVKG